MFEIGNTLREARVRRKLTLQQAEDDTKIRVKYIQAMENEDFDVMPSPAYVKGFLRTYATYLGLDADLILEEYRSRFEPMRSTTPSAAVRRCAPTRHARRNTLAFVAVVVSAGPGARSRSSAIDAPTSRRRRRRRHRRRPPRRRPSRRAPRVPSRRQPSPKPVVLRIRPTSGTCTSRCARRRRRQGPLRSQPRPRGARARSPATARSSCASTSRHSLLVAANGRPLRRPVETIATDYLVTSKGISDS